MAMIFCTSCQNEYDSHNATCPYCNHVTPSTKKFKGKLLTLLVIGIIIVTVKLVDHVESVGLFENAQGLPSWLEQISPDQAPADSTSSGSALPSLTPTDVPVQTNDHNGQPLGGILSQYARNINVQLNDISPSKAARLPDDPTIANSDHTFTHTLNRYAELTIRLNAAHNQILSVELHNSNTRNNRQIMPQIAAILLSSLPSQHTPLDEARAQIEYLNQFAQTARNCTASYEFEGIYLSEHYDRQRYRSTISMSDESPSDAC